jgi:hypothetical protein
MSSSEFTNALVADFNAAVEVQTALLAGDKNIEALEARASTAAENVRIAEENARAAVENAEIMAEKITTAIEKAEIVAEKARAAVLPGYKNIEDMKARVMTAAENVRIAVEKAGAASEKARAAVEKAEIVAEKARAAVEKVRAAIAARERRDFSEETENAEHEFIEPATYGEPLTLVSSSNDSVKLALKEVPLHCVWSVDVEAISETTVVSEDHGKVFTKNHPSGWTITGRYHSDYLRWVEDFSATHQTLGSLRIEDEGMRSYIIATSIAAWNNFVRAHTVKVFDYSGHLV